MRISLTKFVESSRFVKAVCFPILLMGIVSCTSVLDDMTDEVTSIVGEDGALSCVFSGDTIESCLSEDAKSETAIAEDVSADELEDEAFPTLGDVPDSPRATSTVEDLEQLTEGLIADREDAKYTNEVLRSSYASSGEKLSGIPEDYHLNVDQENSERQSNVTARQSSKLVSVDSLAEERRINDVESASDAVFDREYVSKDERKTVKKGNIASRSVGVGNQNGVMAVSKFRQIFDDAFESSGSSTFTPKAKQYDSKVLSDSSSDAVQIGSAENLEAAINDNEIVSLKNRIRLARSHEVSTEQARLSFQVASIPFSVGSASVGRSSRAVLNKVVELYKEFGGVIRVVGHASQRTRDMDPDSHQWVNFNISMDRAENTAILLARLGIPADSIIIMARSDSEQLSREHMPSSESENRRADIYIEY